MLRNKRPQVRLASRAFPRGARGLPHRAVGAHRAMLSGEADPADQRAPGGAAEILRHVAHASEPSPTEVGRHRVERQAEAYQLVVMLPRARSGALRARTSASRA